MGHYLRRENLSGNGAMNQYKARSQAIGWYRKGWLLLLNLLYGSIYINGSRKARGGILSK